MNIIRGLDRIALVIALIAIVPSFFLGMYITYEKLSTLNPDYTAWQKRYHSRKSEVLEKITPEDIKEYKHGKKSKSWGSPRNLFQEEDFIKEQASLKDVASSSSSEEA